MSDYLPLLARRAITQRDPSLLQLSFETALLDRYRSAAGFSIIRTDSAGRIRKEHGWSIDFGIVAEDAGIHTSWRNIAEKLPDEELEHWAAHLIALPLSNNFVRMQISPGGCFDDGELRSW